MLFSIIVPIFKVEDYLHRCVDSVLNQSFLDYELILVDDGSPDNCPKICDDYAQKDKRIKVIHKNNGGLSDARNSGLNIASGEYVLFLDSDDSYLDGALEKLASILKNKKPDILIANLINEDGTEYSPKIMCEIGKEYSGKEYYLNYFKSILDCAVASAYRLSFLKKHHLSFLVGRYHEDSDFTPKAYLLAESIVHSNISLYVRCSRDDSITTKKDKRKNLEDCLFIAKNMAIFANDLNDDAIKNVLMENICMSYLGKFVDANVFQYKKCDYDKYIDKRLIKLYVKKNGFRRRLFCFSPRLYVLVAKLSRRNNQC